MIFSIDGHIKQIIEGTKTQTRRPSDKYKVSNLYAVQPGRGKPGIKEGKIYIGQMIKEWKPDLSEVPLHAFFARGLRIMEAGYPITKLNAIAEGGYTQFEYEELYEEMYPSWTERYVYWFSFFDKDVLDEIQSSSSSNHKAIE